jgi:hypothetical protein
MGRTICKGIASTLRSLLVAGGIMTLTYASYAAHEGKLNAGGPPLLSGQAAFSDWTLEAQPKSLTHSERPN